MDTKKDWIHKYFSPDELGDIQRALDKVESTTVGEIILSVRNKRTLLEKLYTPHELAWKDFNRLGVYNTVERTGMMIFIIFEERYYDIIADEGLYAKISEDVWNEMEEKIKDEFKDSKYFAGLISLIEKTGGVLSEKFPTRADRDNDDEIKDEIVIH